jgi:hypothetical protein
VSQQSGDDDQKQQTGQQLHGGSGTGFDETRAFWKIADKIRREGVAL